MNYVYSAAGVLLGVLLAAAPALAQTPTSFRPGYVLPLTGDTLRGEVAYRDIRPSTVSCVFRADPAAAPVTYLPTQLRAYGLPAEQLRYEALTLPTGGLSSNGTEPSAGAGQRVFARQLARGAATLYTWRDDDRRDHFYVQTAALPLTELVQRQVLTQDVDTHQKSLQTLRIYRNTLAQALPGCPAAQRRLPTLRFEAEELAAVVAAYNYCQNPQAAPPQLSRAEGLHPHLGLVAGASFAALTVSADGNSFSTSNQYATTLHSVSATGGLTLSLPLGLLSHHLSLQALLLAEHQHYTAEHVDFLVPTGNFGYYTTIDLKNTDLRLPLSLRYSAAQGRVRPLLEAGPTIVYSLTVQDNSYQGNTKTGRSAPLGVYGPNPPKGLVGFNVGTGLAVVLPKGRQATLLVQYTHDSGNGTAAQYSIYTAANRVCALLAFDLL